MYDKAILITGGWTEGILHPAELHLPNNGSGCSVPEIPERRNSIPKRLAWPVAGPAELTWNTPSTRTAGGVERTFHVSWSTAAGVHLIGGHGVASNNAERLTEDGSVARTFPLKDLIV